MPRRGEAAAAKPADDQAKPDPVARLRMRAENMMASAAALKKIADAADPLYKTLDDGQKRRLADADPSGPGSVTAKAGADASEHGFGGGRDLGPDPSASTGLTRRSASIVTEGKPPEISGGFFVRPPAAGARKPQNSGGIFRYLGAFAEPLEKPTGLLDIAGSLC